MQCPRCQLALVPDRYEGVPVDRCAECWGYWLDRGELEMIIEKQELRFSDEERREIRIRAKDCLGPGAQEKPLSCPRCAGPMEKVRFNVEVPITIDRCAAHGVWLDTCELKAAQIVAEDAVAVQRVFFAKLREAPPS